MHGEEIVCDCKTQMALRARYLIANIGEQYMRLDWDTFEPEGVKRDIDNYIENRENFLHLGIGLEFGGPLGVGKTFAATYIGREMVKRNQSVYFTRFKDMAFSFEEKDGDVDELCRDSTYLIIDELQVSHSSAQASVFSDRFEAMIRHRTDFDLPTIITTNVSEEALEEAYPRVYSLLAAKQLRLEFEGDDVRKSKMNKENLEMAMNGEKRPIT
jgi:DNA replication protein DnaC